MRKRGREWGLGVRLLICGLFLVVSGRSWASDIDHRDAIEIARARIPAGVAVEVQDERLDPVFTENTYEVALIIRNGRKIADVEINRRTGRVVQVTRRVQTPAQRRLWQDILALFPGVQRDYEFAYRKALRKYPDAAIDEIDLDIELGRLEYDVKMVDMLGNFMIEIDAITGNTDGDDPRGLTFAAAADIARAEDLAATLIDMNLVENLSGWHYVAILTKRQGRRQITVKIDALTGAVLSIRNRRTPANKIADYRAKIQLARNALVDYADALILTREEIGGGQPLKTIMNVQYGALYYKSIFRTGDVISKVWIDAVTGTVFRRR